jgi:hypothetical protein
MTHNPYELLKEKNKELVAKNEELERKINENKIALTLEEYKRVTRKISDNSPVDYCLFKKNWDRWGFYSDSSKKYEPYYWNNQCSHLEFIENLITEMFHYKELHRDYKFKKYYPLRNEVEKLKKEAEENNSLNSKLKEELEETLIKIKNLETELEEADEIIDSHEAALEKAQEWRLRREKELKEEHEHTRDLLWKYTGQLVKKNRQFEVMEEELVETRIKLQKSGKELTKEKQKNEEFQKEFYLNNKPLPKTPSKFKLFKERVKTELQRLIKKEKHQEQELVAKIEVPVK